MLKKPIITFVSFLLTVSFVHSQAPRPYSSSEILQQLKKLNTVGSVLYIAAHPDDENTRLIAYMANEKKLRTGYLSLTRGDGGQNLIGPEQGIELGLIRTQELLAARRTDGGEQYFTRAYDFGFSKTPEETFTKWNKDSILADMVWVIRNFRPDIIITRFAPDGSGGHGHHTASAILAEEAFDAAADPQRFPEQLQYVSIWKTRRMFYNTVARFRDPNADMSAFIKLDVGGYNTLTGKSYGEVSADSRSMHKSQGFGSARQRGEYAEHFKPVKGDTAGLKDIFQGMDFSWKRVKGEERLGQMISRVITDFKTERPENSIPAFEKVFASMQKLPNEYYYQVLLAGKILTYMAGVFVEATSNNAQIAKGSLQKLSVTAINRSQTNVSLDGITFTGALKDGSVQFDTTIGKPLLNNIPLTVDFQSRTDNTDLSQPHMLAKPIRNGIFEISNMFERNAPELFRNTGALARLTIGKTQLSIPLVFQYKWVDPEKGELYRPVTIAPPVLINMPNEAVTFPDIQEKEVRIVAKAGRDNAVFTLNVQVPADWSIRYGQGKETGNPKKSIVLTNNILEKKGDERIYSFWVKAPATASEGSFKASVTVEGIEYTKGIREIKYDHIPVQTWFPEAEAKLIRLDVKRKLKRIGYIAGAGDGVSTCLSQLGYEVINITDQMLASENLNRYDAIVTGVRAYNTNEKLIQYKQKLMDYVAAGGNLIVQYNTNSWAGPMSSDIGPYKFKITRDRVTDEQAKVNFLLPGHPVLNTPNKITDKDFEGWIQERCIYTAGETAPEYIMPLSMADPGEKANNGSLIISKHGKGHFMYTGLVFFRELPAGVPGAYRLFVNMIELGK
jgi:LmbE family N-acetylglucosaminyl deacetylase